jgi:hypothetical protein
VVGVLRGERLEFHADGTLTRARLDRESRLQFLIEELGLDEPFARRCARRHAYAATSRQCHRRARRRSGELMQPYSAGASY